ncbi:MAG: hypothetical protein WAL98_03365 [Desulfatiglandaceae bacterium]
MSTTGRAPGKKEERGHPLTVTLILSPSFNNMVSGLIDRIFVTSDYRGKCGAISHWCIILDSTGNGIFIIDPDEGIETWKTIAKKQNASISYCRPCGM